MDYSNLLKISFKKLRENLILLVPDSIYIVFSIILLIILLSTTGIFSVILQDPQILSSSESIKDFLVQNFSTTLAIIKVLISFLLAIILSLFSKVYTDTIKYNMISNLIKNKTPKLDFKPTNFINLLYLRILVILISIIPLTIFTIIVILLISISKILAAITSILVIASFLFIILTVFVFLFIYPILFLENKSAINTLKASYQFFRKNTKYTIFTELIILGISLALSILVSSFRIIDLTSTIMLIFLIITSIIRYVFSILVRLYTEIFTFYAYKNKL